MHPGTGKALLCFPLSTATIGFNLFLSALSYTSAAIVVIRVQAGVNPVRESVRFAECAQLAQVRVVVE